MFYGYETKRPCEICGKTPAYIEPRFGYVGCEEHMKLPPVRFQEEKDKNESVQSVGQGC